MAPTDAVLNDVISTIVHAVNLHHKPPGSIQAETSLRNGGLELDSIDILEIVVAIEQKFEVKMDDAEVAKQYFKTVGGIAEYVKLLKGLH